ncbi:transcriptional regulator, TetR family [Marvinbryantia formatexigens DSM 14469]|uniref:Transcriptional regulator, TetR family n=1 Tax=Marvinbryantia formatexigens DSM 14469 TaxID=478749 RepID=C6LHF0_9FIRM|nr:TetR/AcrR family transcriptional regulator [Marvinbryantia formatexigens]EET59937.1 transcriptional regulator, TetR family [Marvinbryantia formatexigens DSM 14469]UWO25899.1 TetR/AcrR family transcriptional regulator [Marvinbryantia formatexigens DSM 14469]SDF42162.1 transcriptional regulator, TetR family [Marvinbryantia formatexigens]
MNRKEEIILVTLELAAANGLSNVSMAQIAEKMGIRKPSLYNHFRSKEDIIAAMYQYLREKSKEQLSLADIDYGEFIKDKSLEEALTQSVSNYSSMSTQGKMLSFYKVIYSERAVNPTAARIMAEETKRMISATKNLFYALQVHKKICIRDIDIAAASFALTVHAIMDYQLDCACSGEPVSEDMIQDYIKWFCEQFGGVDNEKNID